MNATSVRDEVTDLLQRLIQVDTTNPPGNETAAAELLRDYLEAAGIKCQLIAKVRSARISWRESRAATDRRFSSSVTRTSCWPTRPSGRCRPSRAS